jgi:hypothetical protein
MGEDLDGFISKEILERRPLYRKKSAKRLTPTQRWGTVLVILILSAFLVIFSSAHLVPLLTTVSDCSGASSNGTAASNAKSVTLIDQLSTQYPNPAFSQNISETAKKAGYDFEYYDSSNTTLDFFVNLPSYVDSILILRTHGAQLAATDPAAIVTSSDYSESQHVLDQLSGNLIGAEVNGTVYFALAPGFISDSMCGHFPGTVIMTMYCWGGQYWGPYDQMAAAFLGKGASAYIGWNNVVTVYHSDLVFESLVKLLLEGKTVENATQSTMTSIGQDQYGAKLVNYSTNSQVPGNLPWWTQYWYFIPAGLLVSIIGLTMLRTTTNKRRFDE